MALTLEAHAQIPPGTRFAELNKQHLPTDRDPTRELVFGDVDSDGDVDLVCGNQFDQSRLYLNNGFGQYSDATAVRMSSGNLGTFAVALGDVDGDADLDMVLGNGGQDTLYLNDGQGTFTDVTSSHLPTQSTSTSAIALSDVDGDGDLDLICGNYREQNRLYRNRGDGVFTMSAPGDLPTDLDSTFSIAIGDLDNDGDLDIVFGNGGQNRLLINAGNGVFADLTMSQFPVDNHATVSLALGDVDADGDLDLVCGNGEAAPTAQPNTLYLNNGAGHFTDVSSTQMPVAAGHTADIALADVDGDRDLDIVCANTKGQQNRLLLNDGRGVFVDTTTGRLPDDQERDTTVAVADVDGDSDLDIVFGIFERQNRILLNTGAGTFLDGTASSLSVDFAATSSLKLGDVDGDSDLDLVCANLDQDRLFVNDGNGAFRDATLTRMPVDNDHSSAVELGDVDLDGDLDLVIANLGAAGSGQQNRLYVNDGRGSFSDETVLRLPVDSDPTLAVAMADFDSDGDLDIIFGNSGADRLYLNAGNGVFTDVSTSRLPSQSETTKSVEVGDVDGDGDLDIAFSRRLRRAGLFLNDGRGFFTDASSTRLPASNSEGTSIAMGDLDGDVDLDIVVGTMGRSSLLMNDGSGHFTDVSMSRLRVSSGQSKCVALGDWDSDGDLDIVFAREGPDTLAQNQGRGMFIEVASQLPPDNDVSSALALGDVDWDGDLDMVIGNGDERTGGQANRLMFNLRRQLWTPHLLYPARPFTFHAYSRFGVRAQLNAFSTLLSTTRVSRSLPPFGVLGVDPMQVLPMSLLYQPDGLGSVTWIVPNVPALAGSPLHAQAFILDWPFESRLSNLTTEILVR